MLSAQSHLLPVDVVERVLPLGRAGGEVEVVELSALGVDAVAKQGVNIEAEKHLTLHVAPMRAPAKRESHSPVAPVLMRCPFIGSWSHILQAFTE